MSRFIVLLTFLNVGQGDTIVISIPQTEEAVIVDCVDPISVFDYLKREKIKHIRALIVTHLHLDHYRGAVVFLNNCDSELGVPCEKLFLNWPHPASKRELYTRLLVDPDHHSDTYADEKSNKAERKTVFQGLKFWADENKTRVKPLAIEERERFLQGNFGAVIHLLHPWYGQMPQLQDSGLNNTSAVLIVKGLSSSALLTGDLEPDGWEVLRTNKANTSVDVLKFPHHGAWKHNNVDALLDSIRPSIVVISVGTEGVKYRHPGQNVFDAIRARPQIRLLCTEATSRCEVDVLRKRNSIINQFHINLLGPADPAEGRTNGCPCAGTTIVELGDTARVIQPSINFHQEVIIKPNLLSHQCAV